MERTPFSLLWSHLFDCLPQRPNLDPQDRHRRRRSLIFSLQNLALGFAHLLWLLPLVFRNREIPNLLFLRGEILSILLLALMAVDVWHLRGHRPKDWSLPGIGGKMSWSLQPGLICANFFSHRHHDPSPLFKPRRAGM
jgi:hypothetical protein